MSQQNGDQAGQAEQRARILPVRLEVEYPERPSRLLIFVKWLAVIPLYIALIFYGLAAAIVSFLGFWAVLFLGRFPEGMFSFSRGFMAFGYKTMAYFPLLLTDHWTPDDKHPLDFQADRPQRLSRLILVFIKLPSYALGIVPTLSAIGLFVLWLTAIPIWCVILVSGRYPKPLFRFSVSLLQWVSRVGAWQGWMRDDFSLFGSTRRVQVSVAIAAPALLFLAVSPWFSLSVPGASFLPGPLTQLGTVRLERAKAMDEAQRLVERFMATGRFSDVAAALALTSATDLPNTFITFRPGGPMARAEVERVFCTRPQFFQGLLAIRPTRLESAKSDGGTALLVLSGDLVYEDGSGQFRATLVESKDLSFFDPESGLRIFPDTGLRIAELDVSRDSPPGDYFYLPDPRPAGFQEECVGGRSLVKPVPPKSRATAVSAGTYHTCALTIEGTVKCWGRNEYGQLGDGTSKHRNSPVDVVGLGSGVTAVSVGGGGTGNTYGGTCAIVAWGSLKCWGGGSGPEEVTGLTSSVVGVSVGSQVHSCAVTKEGGVRCWQSNHFTGYVAGLESGVAAVSAGSNHACAVTKEGGVRCWGSNEYGQLGNGNTFPLYAHSPVDVVGLSNDVIGVSVGDFYTCVVTNKGGVKCWGANWSGQLGDGTAVSRRLPVNVVGLESGVTAVATGRFHACALTLGGGVKCWGLGENGRLGDGKNTYVSNEPVDVAGLTSGVASISGSGDHTCALMTTGGVKCWGLNPEGQLGDGTFG